MPIWSVQITDGGDEKIEAGLLATEGGAQVALSDTVPRPRPSSSAPRRAPARAVERSPRGRARGPDPRGVRH